MKTNEIVELKEKLADIEHQRWADWQEYIFDCAIIKSGDDNLNIRTFAWKTEKVEGWKRQIETDYADLSEEEKQSDRNQVDRYWPLIEKLLADIAQETWREAEGCVPESSPNVSKYCQNRNGIYYCGTCEQAWDDCSCPARNTGFNKCRNKTLANMQSLQAKQEGV